MDFPPRGGQGGAGHGANIRHGPRPGQDTEEADGKKERSIYLRRAHVIVRVNSGQEPKATARYRVRKKDASSLSRDFRFVTGSGS